MITILGLPYDDDSSFLKGTRHAPPIIRNALRNPSSNVTTECGLDLDNHPAISDAGDLELGAGRNAREQIEAAIRNLVMDGQKVLSLGGDHSITYPVLRGYASRYGALNVLQLDAHPDLYDELGGNRYSHACPFARALEDGIVQSLVQVGIRTMNQHQQEQADRFGVQVVAMRDLPESEIVLDGPVYVTLDLDVLDPAFAPGISHYEPGGMSVREVLSLIQSLNVPLIGADVVEFNPTRDSHDMTAMVAAKFCKELLARML